MNANQIGKFKISEAVIRSNPDKVASVIRGLNCIPIRAEMLYSSRAIEITAISEAFRQVDECAEIPSYELEITAGRGGVIIGVSVKELK